MSEDICIDTILAKNPNENSMFDSDGVRRIFRSWQVMLAVQSFDSFIIIIAALIAHFFKPEVVSGFSVRYVVAATIVGVIGHFTFFGANLYQFNVLRDPWQAGRRIALRWTLLFLVLAGLASLDDYRGLDSRLWFAVFFAGGLIGLVGGRLLIAALIRTLLVRGYFTSSAAVIGFNPLTERLIERLNENNAPIRVVGIYDDGMSGETGSMRGVALRGDLDDLLACARRGTIDTAIITLPMAELAEIDRIVGRLKSQAISVRLLPGPIGLTALHPLKDDASDMFGMQMIALVDHPISELAFLAKGLVDRLGAAIILLMVSPLLLACAVGVRFNSTGPIFFRQKRVGYKGNEFYIYKFRTMHVTDQPNISLTARNDSRIFKFGSLLRRTSIDELPQLFNVLKGEMSLVGPRPHMPEARAAGRLYYEAVNDYSARHRVKPGITGWAQINGWRGPTETIEQIERRIEHDIYYINNWSLGLDFMILLKTSIVGFGGRNAF